jgi:hypothetical protein
VVWDFMGCQDRMMSLHERKVGGRKGEYGKQSIHSEVGVPTIPYMATAIHLTVSIRLWAVP